MNIKEPIALLIFTIISGFLQGQPTIPNVVPQSPEASSLTKMYDYPVSNCTGIPDITIPLFEIKSGQLNLPISISYHASGRRVYDKTGAIGLGWTLNAGGMISRIIYGDPDDDDKVIKYPYPWKKVENLSNSNDYRFLAGIDNRTFEFIPWYDTEYDIFTYSANGLYGNFILKDIGNDKAIVQIPKKPFTISMNKKIGTSNNYIDFFEITDDNGITYRFGKSNQNNVEYREIGPQATSGWMLTEIISANKADTIHFKYTYFTNVRKSFSTTYTKISGWTTGDLKKYPAPSPNVTTQESTVAETYSSQRITEISYRQGKIVFNLQEYSGFPPDKNQLVKSIAIKNRDNVTIKTIEFNQSVLSGMTDGLISPYKLDNVYFKDKNLTAIENYAFEYYPTPTPINVRSQDFWGYYNASGQFDMCPFIPAGNDDGSVIVNPNANRNSNEDAMKSGVLKKIIYPTGGSTEFIYQVNKYYDQGIKSCGGLRIYQIKSVDLNNNTLLRTFKYGINECGYGYLPLTPNASTISYSTQRWNMEGNNFCANSYTETQYFSNVLPIFNYVAEKPVIYTAVTEYLGDLANPYGNGKIIYTYDRDDMTPPTMQVYGAGGVNYRLWKRSDLLSKNIFAKTDDPANPYKLVKYLTNTYAETEYAVETIYGLRLRRLCIMLVGGQDAYTSEEYYLHYGIQIYALADYTISVGKKDLTKIEEGEITSNGTFSKVTTNTFDENHLLKEQRLVDSKGNTLKKEYLHPVNFTGDPYGAMVLRNMVNPVVELNEYDNAGYLESTKINYYDWGNNIITPITVQTKNKINPAYETRIRYQPYDNYGNILGVSKEGDIITSYIWGYNNTYPVVKAVNVTSSDLALKVNTALQYASMNINTWISDPETEISKWTMFNSKLRELLPNALITTYTYKLLTGMTSSTDANGKTNYYIYDSFGRLQNAKDQDINVIQEYKYHYKE